MSLSILKKLLTLNLSESIIFAGMLKDSKASSLTMPTAMGERYLQHVHPDLLAVVCDTSSHDEAHYSTSYKDGLSNEYYSSESDTDDSHNEL